MIEFVMPVKAGRLNPSDPQKDKIAVFLQGKTEVLVTIQKPQKGRSAKQNAYLWSCVYPMMAAESGHTAEELHEFCKQKFLPRSFIIIGTSEGDVRKSTKDMTTVEFTQYVDQVVAFAGRELHIAIPLPNDQ